MISPFWRKKPVPTAREERDVWLRWMELDGRAKSTIDGYRQITDKLLARWPEFSLGEFNDDHITGLIEESRPCSRQSKRGAFANLFGWATAGRHKVELDLANDVMGLKEQPEPGQVYDFLILEVVRRR